MTATSLFVVPRSMPMMVSGMIQSPVVRRFGLASLILGHAHLGEPEDPAPPLIAAAHFVDHFAGRPAAARHDLQSLHAFGIERRADTRDGFEFVLLEGAFHALHAHCIPSNQRFENPARLTRRLARPLQLLAQSRLAFSGITLGSASK